MNLTPLFLVGFAAAVGALFAAGTGALIGVAVTTGLLIAMEFGLVAVIFALVGKARG